MNIDAIKHAIIKYFESPLEDGENRKIVYWIDTEKAFIESFEEVEIDNVKKHYLNDNNHFYTKYLLEEEDAESHYLIHTTSNMEIDTNNWLADNLLYSQKFYADEVSNILIDLDIPTAFKSLISDYVQFFRNKERYKRFNNYQIDSYNEDVIKKAMICTICKQNKLQFDNALRVLFSNGLDDNGMLKDIYSFFGEEDFWQVIAHEFGYGFEKDKTSERIEVKKEHSLKKLAYYLFVTASAFTSNKGVLDDYQTYIAHFNKNNCMMFIDRWMNSMSDIDSFKEVSEVIETDLKIDNFLSKLDALDIDKIEVWGLAHKHIIISIATALMDRHEDYENYISLIRNRQQTCFYSEYKSIYEALFYTVKMFEFKKNREYLLTAKPINDMVESYTSTLYEMDTYYRKFYVAYDSDSDKEIMKKLKGLIEPLYNNWYLMKLSGLFSDELRDNTSINSFNYKYQKDFYNQVVNNHLKNKEKVFVIISDALRYEVGYELSEKIKVENSGVTTIEPMISAMPSVTHFGMASLLPHDRIEYAGEKKVYVDGMSSAGLENRAKILAKACEDSLALDYKDLTDMNNTELSKLSTGKKVIYIYHNSVDAIGDKAATEVYAFDGCEKAVDELSTLVKTLKNRMSGTNIYITADHGFIYVRDKIEETDKISKTDEFIESGRRYAIGEKLDGGSSLLEFDLSEICAESDYKVYTPKDNIRFKIQGGGANFVHGGASLHEMVIPLISYKNKRLSQKGSVTAKKTEVKLTSTVRKITNTIFKLNFFQTEKVEDKVIPCSVKAYFVDSTGNVISNEQTIIADKKSSNPEDRTFALRFTLDSNQYDRNEKYKLIIKDIDTDLPTDTISFEINLGIINDFDF